MSTQPRPSYSARADEILQHLEHYVACEGSDPAIGAATAQVLATMTLANEVLRLRLAITERNAA